MNGIGLVLAGGGGKGAYQIGVWKYLHECGLDRYVRAVSGTSVGSLNAALFASGDFQRAEDLWLNIQPSQILSPRKVSLSEVIGWIISNKADLHLMRQLKLGYIQRFLQQKILPVYLTERA